MILYGYFHKFSENREKEFKLGPMYYNFPVMPMYYNFLVMGTASPATYGLLKITSGGHEIEAAVLEFHRFL